MMALLNWRVWAAVALAVALAASHWKAYHLGGAAARAQALAAELAQAQQTAELQSAAAAATATLQANADKLRKSKNAQITSLGLELDDALKRLRERPARPGASDLPTPAGPGTVPGSTGAGLYREDGEFLTREAARAKRLQLDLTQCQAAYSAARAALN